MYWTNTITANMDPLRIMANNTASLTYQQRAVNTGWRETGYLILKVDSLSAGKKAVFTSEEVCLARTAVNQLRNKKIQQRKHTDATDDMLYQLENAGLRQR